MREDVMNSLREIGRQLDLGVFPFVKNGGIVLPSEPTFLETSGKENHHGTSRQKRSTAGTWTGPSGWQGAPRTPPGGSWSASQAAPVIKSAFWAKYREELSQICQAYPNMQVWQQEDDFWLLAESRLLAGLERKANFLVGVSTAKWSVRGWGFWGSPFPGFTWIGPRHTNFPDGSICAYEPADGTWAIGDPILELLDLYTVWALRHLHLEIFGRWPGPQAVAHPYERILELREDEHCGCGQSVRRYAECCRDGDLARNRIEDALNFCFWSRGGLRRPPSSIQEFVRQGGKPPDIAAIFS